MATNVACIIETIVNRSQNHNSDNFVRQECKMKITLNTETGDLLVASMTITEASISKTIRDALTMYLKHLKDQDDPISTTKKSSSLQSSQDKS